MKDFSLTKDLKNGVLCITNNEEYFVVSKNEFEGYDKNRRQYNVPKSIPDSYQIEGCQVVLFDNELKIMQNGKMITQNSLTSECFFETDIGLKEMIKRLKCMSN